MLIPGLSVLKRHVHWILLDVLVTFLKVVTKHLRAGKAYFCSRFEGQSATVEKEQVGA